MAWSLPKASLPEATPKNREQNLTSQGKSEGDNGVRGELEDMFEDTMVQVLHRP